MVMRLVRFTDIRQVSYALSFVRRGNSSAKEKAAWSQGTTKKYAYYTCRNQDCKAVSKNIPKDELERDFARRLKTISPKGSMLDIAKAMFLDAWEQRSAQWHAGKSTITQEIAAPDKKLDGLSARMVETTSPRAIKIV